MAVLSCCRAVGWRLSCYGRQVINARVGSHMDILLTNSSQIFFYLKSVLVQIHLGNPLCSCGATGCLEPVLVRALAPACVAPPERDLYLRKLKLCARTSRTSAVPPHTLCSIKILGVKI
jgi:hypothetical protein